MLCRFSRQSLKRWRAWEVTRRSVFSFKFEGVPFKNDRPKGIDVDSLADSAAEEPGLKLNKRGHISVHVMKQDPEVGVGIHKRRKLLPREKYMFKKMREWHRSRPSDDDPGSDLTPLYAMTRPWWGFTSMKGKQKMRPDVVEEEEEFSEKERIVIGSIRKTIEESQQEVKAVQEEKTGRRKRIEEGPRIEVLNRKSSLNFFRSAENIAQSPEEEEPSWNEVLAERLAMRLHKNDVHMNCSVVDGTGAEVQESTNRDRALAQDPSFRHDALKLEAESKELENVDQWIGRLQEFAKQHEKVLDAMDKSGGVAEGEISSIRATGDLGASGEALKVQMIESGINVATLEKQARKELKREVRKTKSQTRHPT